MTFEIDFTEQYEFIVEVYDGINKLGNAQLKFGDGTAILLIMEMSTYVGPSKGGFYDRLVVNTLNGDSFTLFNCSFYGVLFITSDFIVVGNIEDNFSCIKIRFLEISDWFFQGRFLSGEYGDTLTWEKTPSQIDVTINSSENNFNLVTESYVSSKTEGDAFIVTEYVFFVIKSLAQGFSVDDLKNKAIELPTLLSILLGQPLSIINVMVSSNSGGFAYAYLPVYKVYNKNHRHDGFWIRCLLQKKILDGSWQDIFEKYYSGVCQDLTWRKLSGMHRYNGFWEFGLFGYISLLDSYVKKCSEINDLKPSDTKLKDTEINNIINSKRLNLTEDQKNNLSTLLKAITKKRDPSFIDKFKDKLSSTDEDIVKIISFNEGDFKLIKNKRDIIAHGDDICVRSDEYQKIKVVLNKIILIMTYWCLQLLGVHKDVFIKSLSSTHNPMKLVAEVNEKHIERITGYAEFISVSDIEFNELSKIKIKISICMIKDGDYRYSDEFTGIYKEYMKNPVISLNPSIGYLFSVDDSNITHKGKVYIEHNSNELCFHDVLIITKNKNT